MGSFVQARYVHWHIVGKCPIHKNTLVVVQLFVKAQYSYLIQFLFSAWLDFYLDGLAFRLFLVENFIVFSRASQQPPHTTDV